MPPNRKLTMIEQILKFYQMRHKNKNFQKKKEICLENRNKFVFFRSDKILFFSFIYFCPFFGLEFSSGIKFTRLTAPILTSSGGNMRYDSLFTLKLSCCEENSNDVMGRAFCFSCEIFFNISTILTQCSS